MKFRSIEPKDNAQMAKIVRYNFEKVDFVVPGTAYFDPCLDTLSDVYLEPGKRRYYFILAGDNDEVLGGCGVAEAEGFENTAEIQKFYFADEVKGKGFGNEAMKLLEKKALELGYDATYIETHSIFEAALHLYDKYGYKKIERPAFVQHGAMDTYLLKKLNDRNN